MLILRIEPRSREPIYRQVVRRIIELVEDESLKEGEILPPTRELAASLDVSRFTVNQAYRELWAKGYVDARPGSYTRVRRRPKLALSGGAAGGSAPASAATRYAKRAVAALGGGASFSFVRERTEGFIDFTALSLDERLFPVEQVRAAYSRVLTRNRAGLLNYAEAAGYRPLREYIAGRMRAHCVEACADEVLITQGSVQGLELAAKLFVDPGDSVVLEEPTFSSAIPLFRLQGARLASLPMKSDGADLDRLAGLIASGKRISSLPSLIYTIPTFHNPTGATTAQPHRERLLSLCEEAGIPLVEDSFQEEITYFGKAVLPIKSMDAEGRVLYLGSFSKVLFPGARLGWIVARADIVEKLAALKRIADISSSPFAQAALLRFCESGAYDQHLRRVNRVFAERTRRAVDALRRFLPPEKAAFAAPSGGYLAWIALKTRRSEEEIQAALKARGVGAAPGGLFFARPPAERYLRISISALDAGEIEEGARRLGEAIRDL